MIIAKNLDGTYFWAGYHKDIGNTKSISINDTGASYPEKTWNDTTPSASVFTLGASTETSAHRFNYTDEDFIAYCFHSVEGYSKVGSYKGGGSDYPFIYTGFKPAFFMTKVSTTSDDWMMLDNTRSPYNQMIISLAGNDAKVEISATGKAVDFCSNGIKMRNADNGLNQSGQTFVYIAFAESPFKTSNAR